MSSAIAVAQAFLDLAHKERKQLSNMQLQKLVFFAHGVYLGVYDKPLIDEPVMAWNFGPVIPRLYEKLQKFGSGNVSERLIPESKVEELPASAKGAIRSTWDVFGQYSAWDLSNISHASGGPWDTVWNSLDSRFSEISNDLIASYYKPLLTQK